MNKTNNGALPSVSLCHLTRDQNLYRQSNNEPTNTRELLFYFSISFFYKFFAVLPILFIYLNAHVQKTLGVLVNNVPHKIY